MTCKDCIHYEVCCRYTTTLYAEVEYRNCADFKDKSRFFELPCKLGDTVYVLRNKSRTELEIRPAQIFRISYAYTKKESEIWISAVVRMVDIASFAGVFQFNDRAFATKEDAEKALKEMKK